MNRLTIFFFFTLKSIVTDQPNVPRRTTGSIVLGFRRRKRRVPTTQNSRRLLSYKRSLTLWVLWMSLKCLPLRVSPPRRSLRPSSTPPSHCSGHVGLHRTLWYLYVFQRPHVSPSLRPPPLPCTHDSDRK